MTKTPQEFLYLQQVFIRNLVDRLRDDREIIYLDETSTNLWQMRKKLWMHPDNPMKVPIPADKGKNITIIGAITTKSDQIYYRLCDTTNKQNLKDFLG